MSEWRDISTAPKDGTAVIVFSPSENLAEPTNVIVAKYESFGPDNAWWGFCESVLADISGMIEPEPTHWMPLPIPPPPEKENT